MKDPTSNLDAQMLSSLSPGDHVEAYSKRDGICEGTVETVAPKLGLLWIRTMAGERKLVGVDEHTIRPILGSQGLFCLSL